MLFNHVSPIFLRFGKGNIEEAYERGKTDQAPNTLSAPPRVSVRVTQMVKNFSCDIFPINLTDILK
jgi:hypothetical protein